MKTKKIENTPYSNVFLRNFWPIGTPGHVSNKNIDITRNFLASFVSEISGNNSVLIDSHFEKKSIFARISNILIKDNAEKQYIAHYTEMAMVKTIKALYVWYTSENRRPPLNLDYDLFLSHDFELYNGRNVYLPFWATRLGNNIIESTKNQEKLLRGREIISTPVNFACAVISNPEPVRMEFIRQLSKIGKVDIYGKLGKKLSSKAELFNKYRFNICFENSYYPGYVTEKPFEAWEQESVPVWNGFDSGGYLNPSAIINVGEIGFKNALEQIYSLEKNYGKINEIIQLPILKKVYDYKVLSTKSKSILFNKSNF
jgi:hypothetical protein